MLLVAVAMKSISGPPVGVMSSAVFLKVFFLLGCVGAWAHGLGILPDGGLLPGALLELLGFQHGRLQLAFFPGKLLLLLPLPSGVLFLGHGLLLGSQLLLPNLVVTDQVGVKLGGGCVYLLSLVSRGVRLGLEEGFIGHGEARGVVLSGPVELVLVVALPLCRGVSCRSLVMCCSLAVSMMGMRGVLPLCSWLSSAFLAWLNSASLVCLSLAFLAWLSFAFLALLSLASMSWLSFAFLALLRSASLAWLSLAFFARLSSASLA